MYKNLLFAIFLICSFFKGYGQTTIVKQSFESTGDTWTPLTFSTTPCTNGSDRWDYSTSLSSINPSEGLRFWGIRDLNGNCGGSGYETITFPNENISSYTGVTISFDYYTIDYDNPDNLGYEIWEDGAKVVDLVNLNNNSSGWLTITYNVTATVSNVYLVLKAKQDGGSDYAGFDNVELKGTSSVTPTITVSPTALTGLDYSENLGPSAEQSFTVEGSNLTDDITLTPPANFEISLSPGTGYVSSPTTIPLAPSSGTVSSTPIYVRLVSGLTDNSYSGNITAVSTLDSVTENVAVSGDVIRPVITVSPTTLTGLDYVFGSGPSAEQTFTVSGTNLSANITLTAPTNFQISTSSGSGFVTTVTLTPVSETVASTIIYVRLASGLAVNAYGPINISANSAFATTKNVSVSGEVTAPAAPCDELFISEYIEGSGSNKYIEIYNPTGASIDLSNYQLVQYNGLNTSPTSTLSLSGSLASYSTFVVANSSATIFAGTIDLSTPSAVMTFNGNDAIALQTSTNVNIDVVGTIGSSSNFAEDIGLQRKNTVQNPVTSYDSSEWNILTQDDVSNLGSHTSDCNAITPTINVSVDAVSLLNYTVGSGPSVAQPFTVAGTDLTDDITLTAPTNFQISTDNIVFSISPITLPQIGGTVATTTIYVRLAESLGIGSYTDDLSATSTGAATKNITFNGDVLCIPTHTITNFAPISGPIGTEVTITGTGFTASSTVDFDGIAATVTYINATTLIAEVPVVTASNYITVTESGCGLNSVLNFTIISDNGCVGESIPAGWTDLMLTGVYDDETLSCHYIELFNPTTSAIDLSNYTLGFDNNFTFPSAVPITGFTGLVTLTGTIPAESTFMIQITTISGGCSSCSEIIPDYTFVGSVGLNVDDRLVLVENYGSGSAAAIDVWQNHASELGGSAFNKGYIFSRAVTANAPATSFSLGDWDANDTENCFGFALSSAVLPTINTQPIDVTSCSSADFTVAATAGSGGALSYQWRYNDGSSAGWTDVDPINGYFSASGTVTGATGTNLVISGFAVNGYQFYCEVKENLACSVASNAAQVTAESTTWDGSSWSNGNPTIDTAVTLNENYNTATDIPGNFSACSLVVSATFTLTVEDNTYVEVENNTDVYGTILVATKGAFVQNNDNGTFTLYGSGTASVNKTTAPINAWYEYTYWSSPVENETIGDALVDSPASRRFWFDASKWLDATYETANDNTAVIGAGEDNVDDNGDDWQYAVAGAIMDVGVGYAATYSPSKYTTSGQQYTYNFEGPFNTGIIPVPVVINTELGDVDWNFIGNPYPSAVDSDKFIAANAGVLQGALYFWSHNTPPSSTVNGNRVLNFSEDDYGIYNGVGSIVAGDGIVPNGFIPSGQGFFVAATASGDVVFNNSMRIADISSNNQFFKGSKAKTAINSESEAHKIWLNLTSDNGVFSQILVGYVDGATNAKDGMLYDVPRFLTKTGSSAILYSNIEEEPTKYYAIQGKNSDSLNRNESISLGFTSTIKTESEYSIEIDRFEGEFLANNPIYLKDNLLGTYHELSASKYTFSSEADEYKSRFEIVFKDSRLPINNLAQEELVIFELNDGNVQFTVNDLFTIKNITIIDFLGRNIYTLKGSNYTETYNLSKLSTAMYIAKVELSDGSIIIKKAIKNL